MRKARSQAFAAWRPTMAARHVGRSPALIDQHQPIRIKILLALEPVPALLPHVRSVLLAGMAGLLLPRQPVAGEEAPERAVGYRQTVLAQQPDPQLVQSQVGLFRHL